MISVVVIFYSNTIKSMLVGYAITDMGCFDDYSYAAAHAKTIRGNGTTTFLLHASQCINFCQNNIVTATLIAEASLKSFYSRLGFKVIKDFATSPNFLEACKRFNYESVKSKAFQKKTIGLQYHKTIPRRVTNIHDNLIEFNENGNVFKDLNEVPPSDYWLPYDYIDTGINKNI